MVYKVIGLMSGSSLDGLDIVYTQLEEIRGQWSFEIKHAACIPYDEDWTDCLRNAAKISVPDFLTMHTSYGHYMGEQVMKFMEEHGLEHKVDFIATHGHTVYHDPENMTTFQIGDGSAIAAHTSLPVISDLRALDVALGGQGAPIAPIGDRLLFGNYDYLLNIGGIANLTVQTPENIVAFDVCPANQVLNTLAQKEGHDFDAGGAMAAKGKLLADILGELNEQEYYHMRGPKSLSNEAAVDLVFPSLLESDHEVKDMLYTMVQHVAEQVATAVAKYPPATPTAKMLITGGGAFNEFLVSRIRETLGEDIEVIVPNAEVVKFKEALIMALIGTLRWREETNVYSSVTGADRDSVSGAIWMGQF